MTGLQFSIRHHDDELGYLIVIAGDADVSAASELRELIDAAAATTVLVDLAQATLIDSRMIAVLVDATERLRRRGRALFVLCAEPNILRLFRRIGLEGELAIFPSRAAAAQVVRGGEEQRG